MAINKKQIIYPAVALVIGIAGLAGFSALKKPPEEKEKKIEVPLVKVEAIEVAPMQLNVGSYGLVKPKYETTMVAQVSGQIVELSDAFVKGGFVKKGQLLARIDPNDYDAALIDANASQASAIAALELERAAGRVAEVEWRKITSTEATDLALRKPQLAQELARLRSAEATVKRAKRNLERTYIVAPYDALIESRNIGLGAFVGTGSEIGKLLSVSVAEVRMPVADNQLKYLEKQGDGASVVLEADFSGNKQSWHATIARSEGLVDGKSRMTYLVAEIIDPYGRNEDKLPLRFGTYVTAEIKGVMLPEATAVPRHLVNKGQVSILGADNKLEFRQLDILRQEGKDVIATGGLVTGDQLIVSALDFPVAGMTLRLPGQEPNNEDDAETDVAVAMKE